MKKLSLLLVLATALLTLAIAGCGGGSGSDGIGGTSIGGGAAKAPINGGKVYVNGTFVTTTDSTGNFSLSTAGYSASDYPLTVEIRGGSTPLQTYGDDVVVLDGYMYSGDSTIYLSTFSMMEKRWVDSGLTREQAAGRIQSVFNAIAAIVGFDVSGVTSASNPVASNAFEVVQQGLMNYLGVDESTATNIGSSVATALDTNLTGSTTAAAFNTAVGNVVNAVVANRQSIIQAAATARGTTLSMDSTQIEDAIIGLNPWAVNNGGTATQDGTLYVDLNSGGNVDLVFHFDYDIDPLTGGTANTTAGGVLKITGSTGAIAPDSTEGLMLASVPTMDGLTVGLGAGLTTITAGTTSVNNSYVTLRFACGTMTAAQKLTSLDNPLTVRFYAEDDTNVAQTFTVRFYDSTNQSSVTGVDMSGSTLAAATYNFGASDTPLYINASDGVTGITPANFTATVSYDGADNLDGVFLRFLAPAGFKFNRSGWSTAYRNLDIYNLTITNAAGNTTVQDGDSTQIPGSGNLELWNGSSAQPVGLKEFTVEVKDKTTNQVRASDSKSVYFTTTDSLDHIASIDLTDYNTSASSEVVTYTTSGGSAVQYGPDLANFTGTVSTWGTLSGQDTSCAAAQTTVQTLSAAATSSWKLRLWSFNSDADVGFSYDGSTWSQNLDIQTAGAAIESSTVAIADDCALTINPGANSRYLPYFVSGYYNQDKVSAVFSYDGTGTASDYTVTADPLTFKAP